MSKWGSNYVARFGMNGWAIWLTSGEASWRYDIPQAWAEAAAALFFPQKIFWEFLMRTYILISIDLS